MKIRVFVCGNCLFAEDKGSSDMLYCWKKERWMKVNDYPCGWFKEIKGELNDR